MTDIKIDGWKTLGEYFNCNGVLRVSKTIAEGTRVELMFSSQDYELLNQMRTFLKYGNVKERSDLAGCFRLKTYDKKEVLDFIINVYSYAPLRKPLLDFFLDNFIWQAQNGNKDFDTYGVERIIKIWKLKVKQIELIDKKTKAIDEQLQEESKGGANNDIHL